MYCPDVPSLHLQALVLVWCFLVILAPWQLLVSFKWLLPLWARVGLTYWTTAHPSDRESGVWGKLID